MKWSDVKLQLYLKTKLYYNEDSRYVPKFFAETSVYPYYYYV